MTGLVAAPMRFGRAAAEPPPEAFTQVELVWIEKQTEHWIRFGRERREHQHGRQPHNQCRRADQWN